MGWRPVIVSRLSTDNVVLRHAAVFANFFDALRTARNMHIMLAGFNFNVDDLDWTVERYPLRSDE